MTLKDPVRQLIDERSKELEISHAELSRLIGRGASYINQYLNRGSPVVLDDRERAIVAKALDIDEANLLPDSSKVAAAGIVVARNLIMSRSSRHLPVFTEEGEIDFDRVTEWTERPDWVTISEQSFAMWITKSHARLGPGDLAYVTGGRPPRPKDTVFILTMDQRTLIAIGTLTEIVGDRAMVLVDGGQTKGFNRRAHVILKVAAVRCA